MARRKSQPKKKSAPKPRLRLPGLLRRKPKSTGATSTSKSSKGRGTAKPDERQAKPSIRRKSLNDPPDPNVNLPPLPQKNRVPQVTNEGMSLDRKLDYLGVLLVIAAVILSLSGVPRTLCEFSSCTVSENGALTEAVLQLLGQLFGWYAQVFIFMVGGFGLWLVLRNFRRRPTHIRTLRVLGMALLALIVLGGTHYLALVTTPADVLINGEPADAFNAAQDEQGGGYIGAYVAQGLIDAIGELGTAIVLTGLLIPALMLTFDISIGELADFLRGLSLWLRNRRGAPKPSRREPAAVGVQLPLPEGQSSPDVIDAGEPVEAADEVYSLPPEVPDPADEPAEALFGPPMTATARRDWNMPDHREILEEGGEQEIDDEVLVQQARIIEDTLQGLSAPGRVVEINPGPVITQFGVEPDYLTGRSGKKVKVKVNKIAGLAGDLALALAAKAVRVEAPVPGKGFVGVEVPNPKSTIVNLREVIESDAFKKVKGQLRVGMGQSVDGEPVVVDLADMPHLLIAGATGSGKSVCVNAIIACLLLHNSPADLRFIMIDPKRVELTTYNDIPHLITQVVTDVERTVGTLKWVTREMDDRYRRFARAGARNISSYNKKMGKNGVKLPYLVVVVDELADLMMMAPQETESVVTRIAQMARATGIHLIISTQRPSVDVVTGLIKANFPARIAFAVASGVDSRVILDMPGAERLLGRGDMLYQAPDASTPVRLQGVFVSDEELDLLVHFWQQQNTEAAAPANLPAPAEAANARAAPPPARAQRVARPAAVAAPVQSAGVSVRQMVDNIIEDDKEADEPDDDLYPEAEALVRREGKASTSMLQRHLRVGYTRASRLMDMLDERGVIGPAETPSKPRPVLPADAE